MKRFFILVLAFFVVLTCGCARTKKPAVNTQPTANSKKGSIIKVPEVPDGADPELWMADYGNLSVEGNNADTLAITSKDGKKEVISDKMGSDFGAIFKVSPDRTKVMYIEPDKKGENDFNFNVLIYNAKSKSKSKLVSELSNTPQYTRWSPDGKYIIINNAQYPDDLSKSTFDCKIYDTDSCRIAASIPAVDFNWSPDGTKIVFTKIPDNLTNHMFQGEDNLSVFTNTMGIYDMDTKDTKFYSIESDKLIYLTPQYSQDGKSIFYTTVRINDGVKNYPAPIESLIADAIYVYPDGSDTGKRIVDSDFINISSPENGYGDVSLNKDLLIYGGFMKNALKVMNLKTGASKVYNGLCEPSNEEDNPYKWQSDGSIKIKMKDKTITIGQDLQEK